MATQLVALSPQGSSLLGPGAQGQRQGGATEKGSQQVPQGEGRRGESQDHLPLCPDWVSAVTRAPCLL